MDASGGEIGTAILLLLVAVAMLGSAVVWWRRVVPYNRWVRQNMERTAQVSRRWSEQLSRVTGSGLMICFAAVLTYAAVTNLRGR